MGQMKRQHSMRDALDDDIRALDLVPVRFVLAISDGWPLDRVLAAEADYRCFLQRVRSRPRAAQVPSRDADLVWHAHILCTERYAEDCQRLFGRFLHHYPFAGRFGRRGAQRQQRRFLDSQATLAEMQRAHR